MQILKRIELKGMRFFLTSYNTKKNKNKNENKIK